ncbi:hypothetical protein DY000_02040538 [Brassica cretica]|uniref:Uncharacterized protein n=1 Tax=Brassica cretica TaxID=69181 RepID=A0ABQ7B6W4_BRACR|nr:hypothetical protein DY000_02040538 [Brassica cretica]
MAQQDAVQKATNEQLAAIAAILAPFAGNSGDPASTVRKQLFDTCRTAGVENTTNTNAVQVQTPGGVDLGLIPRNIPRDLFLGIFRGFISSEFPDENSEKHFVGTSEVNSEDVLPRYIPRSFPTNWWSSEFPRKFVSSEFRRKIPRDFRGKWNFRGVISEDLFRRYVVGITLF